MGDYAQAQWLLEKSLVMSNVHGITAPLTLLHLGTVAQETLNFELARVRFEQALAGFRNEGSVGGVAASLNNLGGILTNVGDLENALVTYEESLKYKLELGGDIESVLINLGDLQRRLGNHELAQSYFLRALKGLVERGFHVHISVVLEGLGGLAAMQEYPESASVLFGAASVHRETMNFPAPPYERNQLEQDIATIRSALGEEARPYQETQPKNIHVPAKIFVTPMRLPDHKRLRMTSHDQRSVHSHLGSNETTQIPRTSRSSAGRASL